MFGSGHRLRTEDTCAVPVAAHGGYFWRDSGTGDRGMPLARPRGNISHPECTSVPAAQVAGMRITRGMGMVLVMSFFSLQVQGSFFFFSQFLFSHSPRSLDALSVASTALKTGPRPNDVHKKPPLKLFPLGCLSPNLRVLPARLSKRHPAYECPEVSVQKQQPIILIVGPRLDSVQVQLGVSSMYSVQLRQKHKSCRASASPT